MDSTAQAHNTARAHTAEPVHTAAQAHIAQAEEEAVAAAPEEEAEAVAAVVAAEAAEAAATTTSAADQAAEVAVAPVAAPVPYGSLMPARTSMQDYPNPGWKVLAQEEVAAVAVAPAPVQAGRYSYKL
jgi:hypothetical protein